MERRLAELESLLAWLWPRLATDLVPLSLGVRKSLALFIATLYLRHPQRRELQKDIHHKMTEFFDMRFKSLGYRPREILVTNRGRTLTSSTDNYDEWKNASEDDHHRVFVDFLRDEAIHLARVLLKNQWSVIVGDRPVFVTSDEPVVLEGPPERTRATGFGTKGAVVSLPISPHRILRLDDENGHDGLYRPLLHPPNLPIPSWSVFNYGIWVNAHRFMFSSRRPDEVIGEIAEFADWAQLERDDPNASA